MPNATSDADAAPGPVSSSGGASSPTTAEQAQVAAATASMLAEQQRHRHQQGYAAAAPPAAPPSSVRNAVDVHRALAAQFLAQAVAQATASGLCPVTRHPRPDSSSATALYLAAATASLEQAQQRQHHQEQVQATAAVTAAVRQAQTLLHAAQGQYLQQHLQSSAVQQQPELSSQAPKARAPSAPLPQTPQQPQASLLSDLDFSSPTGCDNENDKDNDAKKKETASSTSFSAARYNVAADRIKKQEATVSLSPSIPSSEAPSRRRPRSISAADGHGRLPSSWWSSTSASAASSLSACKEEEEEGEGDEVDDAEKRRVNDKREANCVSARLCRRKKKIYVEDLRSENAELRREARILRVIPSWIVAFDPAGTVSFSSGEMICTTADGLVGASFYDVLSNESAGVIKAAFMDALALRMIGAGRKMQRKNPSSFLSFARKSDGREEEDHPTPLAGGGSIAVRLIDRRDGGRKGRGEMVVSLKGAVQFAGDLPECVCSILAATS